MTFINKKFLTPEERTAYNRAVDKDDHKTEIKYLTLAWNRFIDRYKGNRELFFKDVAEELAPYTKDKYRDLIRQFKEALATQFYVRDGVFYKQMSMPVVEVKTGPDGKDTYIETGETETAEVPFEVIIPKDSYKGFCSYLVNLLREYFRATDYLTAIDITRADLMAVIEEHAQKYYNKPKNRKTKQDIIDNIIPEEYTLQGAVRGKAVRIAHWGYMQNDLEKFAEDYTKLKDYNEKMISVNDRLILEERRSNGGTQTTAIGGVKKSTEADKLLDLIGTEVVSRLHRKGPGRINILKIPFSSLVDKGYYASRKTALRGFRKGILDLKELSLLVETTGTNGPGGNGFINIFQSIYIPQGSETIYVVFSQLIDPKDFFGASYIFRPSFTPSLQERARNLMIYISGESGKKHYRQQINAQGYFSLPFESLRIGTGLPTLDSTKDIYGKIINPLRDAIKEINRRSQEEGTGFEIIEKKLSVGKNTAKEIMSKAYIECHYYDTYREKFSFKSKRLQEAKQKQDDNGDL